MERYLSLFACALGLLFFTAASEAQSLKDFKADGLFIEACSCDIPCPCDLVGLAHGCEGVGFLKISSGEYQGEKLDGVTIALSLIHI